jgi:transcription initiation factor TFIIIB Brf1 subunit/transcription initiation factor TFIIB
MRETRCPRCGGMSIKVFDRIIDDDTEEIKRVCLDCGFVLEKKTVHKK